MAEVSLQKAASTRLRSVDALRGAAALAVVFHHAVVAGAAPAPGTTSWFPVMDVLAELGRLGVPLFFVISGFCIHARWVQQTLAGRMEAPAFIPFWKRRLGRLYPPYLVALLGSMGLVLVAYATHKHWPVLDVYPEPRLRWIGLDFGLHLTMLHGFSATLDRAGGNAPFWTLAREEYFYLLYFPLLAFRRRLGTWRMLAAVTGLGLVLSFTVQHLVSSDTPVGQLWQTSALTLWSQWCLGAVAVEGALGMIRLPSWCRQPLLVPLWGVAAWEAKVHCLPLAAPLWGLTFFTLLNALVHLEQVGRWPRGRLVRGLEGVGLFSYSIYLVHHPVRGVVKHALERLFTSTHLASYLAGVGVVMLAGCVAGYVFFLLVERRFIHKPTVSRAEAVDSSRAGEDGMKLDPVVTAVGEHVPVALLRPLLSRALAGLEVSLCLHRVSETRRTTDWQPYLNIPPSQLDALLTLLVASRPGTDRWLTVTFDDGYADAAEYLESRAARFPSVQWLFFLCPQKTERAAGFRWDEVEVGQRTPAGFHDAMEVASENERPPLVALGQDPLFQLASLEQVRRLAELPNVTLGNHTNCHFRSVLLSPEQARAEFQTSRADFERLFGPQREFAFPFGTPNHDFKAEHVAQLRALGPSLIWSTERRPFRPSERRDGAVLPRFPVNGTWTHRQLALWIASRALIFRARGTSHVFR